VIRLKNDACPSPGPPFRFFIPCFTEHPTHLKNPIIRCDPDTSIPNVVKMNCDCNSLLVKAPLGCVIGLHVALNYPHGLAYLTPSQSIQFFCKKVKDLLLFKAESLFFWERK